MTAHPFTIQHRQGDIWMTVAGPDFATLYTNACELFGEAKANELLALASAEGNLRAGGVTPPVQPAAPPIVNYNPPAPPAPPAGGGWNQPPAQPAQGGGGDWKDNAPMCNHGQRRPYEGTNARGAYSVYFCAADKNTPKHEKCSPIDAVTGKAWG